MTEKNKKFTFYIDFFEDKSFIVGLINYICKIISMVLLVSINKFNNSSIKTFFVLLLAVLFLLLRIKENDILPPTKVGSFQRR